MKLARSCISKSRLLVFPVSQKHISYPEDVDGEVIAAVAADTNRASQCSVVVMRSNFASEPDSLNRVSKIVLFLNMSFDYFIRHSVTLYRKFTFRVFFIVFKVANANFSVHIFLFINFLY